MPPQMFAVLRSLRTFGESLMKPSRLVLALALMLSACGQPNDTKAQDGGGLAEPTRRAPESQGDMQASFAPVT